MHHARLTQVATRRVTSANFVQGWLSISCMNVAAFLRDICFNSWLEHSLCR